MARVVAAEVPGDGGAQVTATARVTAGRVDWPEVLEQAAELVHGYWDTSAYAEVFAREAEERDSIRRFRDHYGEWA